MKRYDHRQTIERNRAIHKAQMTYNQMDKRYTRVYAIHNNTTKELTRTWAEKEMILIVDTMRKAFETLRRI